jgi:anti-sigma B factor antagonist
MAANPVPISSRQFTIQLETGADGVPVLRCNGRLVGNTAEQLKSEVKKLLPEHKRIVVDLSQVDHMDSSGLGTVLAAYISAKSAGADLKLVNLNQRLSDLLKLTRLASVFEGYGEYL